MEPPNHSTLRINAAMTTAADAAAKIFDLVKVQTSQKND
jgi:hypothetical protein